MINESEQLLCSYIDAFHPIIYVNYFDFEVVDELLRAVMKRRPEKTGVHEFNNALGCVDFTSKRSMHECSLERFLNLFLNDDTDGDSFVILKDAHDQLRDPTIIALLKLLAENRLYRNHRHFITIFIISSKLVIPPELENYVTLFDIPLPQDDEIYDIIESFSAEQHISIPDDEKNEIIVSFKGLNKLQIMQVLYLAYQDGGRVSKQDKSLILKEKEQFLKKSGMLELVNFKETIDDIGGLENLKNWLQNKANVFRRLNEAISAGVDIPKGLMIVGMPGCGKSLTAKAIAHLFEIPLVRLDVGRLLGKYVGESEENMRKALKLAEAISPCVLWIDEVEKAFSGIGDQGGGSDVTTRLFGQFLTWMQEKENTVFIAATANDISRVPPEFLRKGRFDELFFVDLPNAEERKKIFEIHLKKRKKWNPSFDIGSLIKDSDGYNGADIEAVVKETVEKAFIADKKITSEDLKNSLKETKSISIALKGKIEKIKESLTQIDIKPASK